MNEKRSYHHFCPLAYSLDAIGDRWSLLLVRELSLGPRRFTDLQRGLAGIGPNLLTRRLKALVEMDVVESVTLPPPARVNVYQLTAAGRELLTALQPLAGWGMRFLQDKRGSGDFVSNVAAMLALGALYRPQGPAKEELSAEVTLEPDVFSARITPDTVDVAQGLAPAAPLAVETTAQALLQLAAGAMTVPTAVAADRLTIVRGDDRLATRFFERLRGI